MTPALPAIAFDAVSKRYADARARALDRVSLDVAGREFVAVSAPPVPAKPRCCAWSTASPIRARARFASRARDVRALDAIELRRRIGYVFQGIGLFPHLTVAENIGDHAEAAGLGARRRSMRASTSCLRSSVCAPRDYRDRLPARAFRRRAPARRRRPRDRREPAGRADGRAVRRARSAHARCARRRIIATCTTSSDSPRS